MTPEEIVRCIDFRYITDALSPGEALDILRRQEPGRAARESEMREKGYPAYTTSAGWIGFSDAQLMDLCREAIANMQRLARFNPWWIEEPNSPDDVLGHAAIRRGIHPIKIATGEHCQNRVIFKQLMQAEAIDFCQIDSCRLGGVNEILSVLLMAAKFGVPVCRTPAESAFASWGRNRQAPVRCTGVLSTACRKSGLRKFGRPGAGGGPPPIQTGSDPADTLVPVFSALKSLPIAHNLRTASSAQTESVSTLRRR